jgi:hypothetical protein
LKTHEIFPYDLSLESEDNIEHYLETQQTHIPHPDRVLRPELISGSEMGVKADVLKTHQPANKGSKGQGIRVDKQLVEDVRELSSLS